MRLRPEATYVRKQGSSLISVSGGMRVQQNKSVPSPEKVDMTLSEAQVMTSPGQQPLMTSQHVNEVKMTSSQGQQSSAVMSKKGAVVSQNYKRHHPCTLTPAERNLINRLDGYKPGVPRGCVAQSIRPLKYSSTMGRQRGRRARRPIFKLVHDDASILDTHYGGQATCLLSTVDSWEFNVFTMDKLTNGRPLFHAGLRMLQDHGLIEHFQLDFVKLMRCISLIEDGYHNSNPYHNAVHGLDVGQAIHCYLKQHKVSQHTTPLEKMIAIFAALAHDVEHPGVNNAFLIATSNHLAALYNNVSVLEYHHWRTTMSIFQDSGIFSHLSKATQEKIEWQMKSLILATDITRQQEFLGKFKVLLDKDDLNLTREQDRHFMLQIALKVADISNPGRPWEVSRRWSELVCDEFFKQGDYERKLGLPVTPLNDRHNTTVAKIQSGFMQFVVLPLFSEWRRFNPSNLSDRMIENIKHNKAEWDAIILQETEEAEREKELENNYVIAEEDEEEMAEGEEDEEDETDLCAEEDDQPVNPSPPPSLLAAPETTRTEFIQMSTKHRQSIPNSSDGESSEASAAEDEEDILAEPEDDGSGDDLIEDEAEMLHVISFMPRRHSLPIHSGSGFDQPRSTSERHHSSSGAYVDNWNFLPPTTQQCYASSGGGSNRNSFSMLAHRRHSLPVSALPNVGVDIFKQLSDRLDTVAECSFNDAGEQHAGEKISLSSLNPGALPDANREASKLTSAHGLDLELAEIDARRRGSLPVSKMEFANSVAAVTTSELIGDLIAQSQFTAASHANARSQQKRGSFTSGCAQITGSVSVGVGSMPTSCGLTAMHTFSSQTTQQHQNHQHTHVNQLNHKQKDSNGSSITPTTTTNTATRAPFTSGQGRLNLATSQTAADKNPPVSFLNMPLSSVSALAKLSLRHHLQTVKDCPGNNVYPAGIRCLILGTGNTDSTGLQTVEDTCGSTLWEGRQERAFSIPTPSTVQALFKSAFSELERRLTARRLSMGDQPIYLNTTPLLNSPSSGEGECIDK